MATFGDMVARIVNDTGRDDLQTSIRARVLDAIRFFQRSKLWTNEARGSFNTVAGTRQYDLTAAVTDFYALQGDVNITADGTVYDLTLVTAKQLDDLETQSPAQRSQPTTCAPFAGKYLQLWPTPDDAYAVSFYYQSVTPAPDLDTDGEVGSASAFWCNDAEPMIRAHATALLYAEVTLDQEKAARHSELAEVYRRTLVTQAEQATLIGQIPSYEL